MKNLVSKHLTLFFAFILPIVTLSLSANAGEGRNGPTWSGLSIPVSLDRGISLKRLNDAAVTCMVTGNEKTGLKSFVQTLHQIIFNKSVKYSHTADWQSNQSRDPNIISEGGFDELIARGEAPISANLAVVDSTSWTTENAIRRLIQRLSGTAHFDDVGYVSFYPLVIKVNKDKRDFFLTTKDSFPVILIDKVVGEPTLDELGNIIESQTLVTGVKVAVSREYMEGKTQMRLYNMGAYGFQNGADAKPRPTSIVIDVSTYVQCLQSEIQRRASK